MIPGDVEGVVCTNVSELCTRVCEAREVNPEEISLLKLGIDGGQGSLKAAVSLMTEDDILPGIFTSFQNFMGRKLKNNCVLENFFGSNSNLVVFLA